MIKIKLPRGNDCVGYKVINNDGDSGVIIDYLPVVNTKTPNPRIMIKFDIGDYVGDYDKSKVAQGKFKHPLRHKYYDLLNGRYNQMINRCYNPNHIKYKEYGAKGVIVCEEWRNSVTQYYYDLINKTSFDENLVKNNLLQLDKDYSNSNLYSNETTKWVTPKENCRNTRKTKLIKVIFPNGETDTDFAQNLIDKYQDYSFFSDSIYAVCKGKSKTHKKCLFSFCN